MLQILDVWGEGRITVSTGGRLIVTGFAEAYNLNKYSQRISNGKHEGQHIPHLIGVHEYDAPAFPLDSRSIPSLTLMGAPITRSVAEEMCRVVAHPGKIFLYDPNEPDRRTFEAVAFAHGIRLDGRFSCADLEPPFNEITLLAAYVYCTPPPPLERPQHLSTGE